MAGPARTSPSCPARVPTSHQERSYSDGGFQLRRVPKKASGDQRPCDIEYVQFADGSTRSTRPRVPTLVPADRGGLPARAGSASSPTGMATEQFDNLVLAACRRGRPSIKGPPLLAAPSGPMAKLTFTGLWNPGALDGSELDRSDSCRYRVTRRCLYGQSQGRCHRQRRSGPI